MANCPPTTTELMDTRHADEYKDAGRLTKLLTYCHGEGIAAAIQQCLARAWGRIFSEQTVVQYIREYGAEIAIIPAAICATVRELSPTDLPLIDAIMYHPTRILRDRFRIGHRCFVAEVGDILACYAWIAPGMGATANRGDIPQLQTDQFYIYNVRTVRAMRGKGLYPYILTSLCVKLHTEGFREAIIRADENNRPSVRGIEKAGFQRVGVIHRRRLLGRTREWSPADGNTEINGK